MSLPALRESQTELERLCEELHISPEKIEQVKDDLLEEKIRSSEQLALLLNTSVADARRVLASDEMSQRVIVCFKKAMLAELDLQEIPMLMNILKAESMSFTPRMRAAKRLRQILEQKSDKPAVQINQQFNNYAIEEFVKKLDDK